MAQENKARGLIGEVALEVPDPGASDSKWFLPVIGLGLLCIYLVGLNFETWGRLEAVCEVAMSHDALSLCLQYGAR
jgi:hypothetical protein